LFRGQLLHRETPIDIYPLPEITIRQFPLPEKASVAVRTRRDIQTRYGSASGAVAFVLDCSGSMREREGADPSESRYTRSVQALRQILQKVPRDTTVSVWIFGQAYGVEKTAAVPEETIRQVLRQTRWNPDDPSQLASLLADLSYPGAVEPWNKSPVARALLRAKEDLKDFKGFKTIVALTDAVDNRLAEDRELKGKYKSVSAFLQTEFQDCDVSLYLLGFPPQNKEEEAARAEFQVIENLNPGGKLYTVKDTARMAELMEMLLRQRLNYFIDRRGQNVTVDDLSEEGLDMSPAGSNYRWYGKGLTPGGHKVRAQLPERLEKDVLLHRGDLLLLDLVNTRDGLQFERYLFSREFPWKRAVENPRKDWQLTVLQNQLRPRDALQMLVTLEKTVDLRENLLEQIKPRDVWFELSPPPEITTATAVRWSYLSGYPAPAWSFDVPSWPAYPGTGGAGRPVVRAWWNPDEEARQAADLELKPLLGVEERAVAVRDEENVILESLQTERHRVEVRPGIYEQRTCLVVRLRHSSDRPILARFVVDRVEGWVRR
jgi:hypothetical protein